MGGIRVQDKGNLQGTLCLAKNNTRIRQHEKGNWAYLLKLGGRSSASSSWLFGVYPVWLHLQDRQPTATGTASTKQRAVNTVRAGKSLASLKLEIGHKINMYN
jgi:hypothetical protein